MLGFADLADRLSYAFTKNLMHAANPQQTATYRIAEIIGEQLDGVG